MVVWRLTTLPFKKYEKISEVPIRNFTWNPICYNHPNTKTTRWNELSKISHTDNARILPHQVTFLLQIQAEYSPR